MLLTNKRLKRTQIDENFPLSFNLIKLINITPWIPNRTYFRGADHACVTNKNSIFQEILGN